MYVIWKVKEKPGVWKRERFFFDMVKVDLLFGESRKDSLVSHPESRNL